MSYKKKILPMLCAGILSTPMMAQAEIKSLVDAHILVHGEMLGGIADSVPANRVQIGNEAAVQDNMALQHAREVALIINDTTGDGARLMEECCWRPQPAVYSNFIVGTTQDILSAASPTPPVAPEDLYNPEDAPNTLALDSDPGRATLAIPANYGDQMASVFDQMVKARDGYNAGLPGGDSMDQFTYDWIRTLTAGIPAGFDFTDGTLLPPDSLASRLVWNWSYQIKKYRQFREGTGPYAPHPEAFLDAFRDFYNWSCILCLGAGFYDTTGMYDLGSDGIYRANEYYDAIVALLPLQQRIWLAQQFDEGFKAADGVTSAPPLQVSFGLTQQSQQANNPAPLDEEASYGAHCHTAAEVYIPIDPMALDKKMGDDVLAGEEGSSYDTDSYMAGLPNTSASTPTFGPFDVMQQQVATNLAGTFTKIANGDIVYWEKRVKHAMFTGQRFQFAAWARVDRPWEGTFFPEDIDALASQGGDEPIDAQDSMAYADVCVDVAPDPANVVYANLCGRQVSFFDNIEIVGPQTAGVTLTGTSGNDLLVTETVGGSVLVGQGGDDCLIGSNAGDNIVGGPGDDTLIGRDGGDNITGGAGIDTIDGGDGIDGCNSGEVVSNCP